MIYFKTFNNIVLTKIMGGKTSFYLYNEVYFSKVGFPTSFFEVVPFAVISVRQLDMFFVNTFFLHFNKILVNMTKLNFSKVKFSGKGYRIYLKKTFYIYAQLGYAHKIFLYNFNNAFKFYGKYRFFIFYTDTLVNRFVKSILMLRFINIFTLRGFRKFDQIIYKKKGKISSYR